MNQDRIESILALDCGSTTTQALLIDRVGGEYRLLARAEAQSTVEPPWNDISASARQAIAQLSDILGWPLLNEGGHVIVPQHQGGGVDAVVAITSASGHYQRQRAASHFARRRDPRRQPGERAPGDPGVPQPRRRRGVARSAWQRRPRAER